MQISFDVKDLQKAMFRQQSFPSVVMHQDAHSAYIRGEVELVRILMPKGELRHKGRCLIHLACFAWYPGSLGGRFKRYFLALEEGVNLLPGFFAGAARCL